MALVTLGAISNTNQFCCVSFLDRLLEFPNDLFGNDIGIISIYADIGIQHPINRFLIFIHIIESEFYNVVDTTAYCYAFNDILKIANISLKDAEISLAMRAKYNCCIKES